MTLIHHADHLADIADKQTIRIEVPFAGVQGTEWRYMEEFETGDPVHEALPENYIEQIVTAYVDSDGGRQGMVGLAPALLVDARPMLAFSIRWLEEWSRRHRSAAADAN